MRPADLRRHRAAGGAGRAWRGILFAFTTIFIKLANQALTGPSLFVRALFALVVTNMLQILMQGASCLARTATN